MRLSLRRGKPFRLFVDSSFDDHPLDRWFRSLPGALRGFRALDDQWKPRAWIIEYHDQEIVGGIPTVRNVVHMRNGRRVDERRDDTAS